MANNTTPNSSPGGIVMLQHEDRCKGCGYCIRECKAGALSFSKEVNASGNTTVIRDADKCTLCGICYITCPDYVFEFVSEQTSAQVKEAS